MNRKLTLMLALLLLPTVAAADTQQAMNYINPDSPMWKLDIAIEHIEEAMAMTDDRKAQVRARHALERLTEMQSSNNPAPSIAEYNKIMGRMQADGYSYETSVQIQQQIDQHSTVLEQMRVQGFNVSDAQTSAAQMREHAKEREQSTISNEVAEWQEFAMQYPIGNSAENVDKYVNLGELERLVPDGISQVTVTTSDGAAVGTYVIKNMDRVITIQTGDTSNAKQMYTVNIPYAMDKIDKYVVFT